MRNLLTYITINIPYSNLIITNNVKIITNNVICIYITACVAKLVNTSDTQAVYCL